jgi:azobenzene reductase
MKIALISGTKRIGRKSHLVATYLQALADAHPDVTETVMLDVADYDFPVMEERFDHHLNPPARLDEFHKHLVTADAIVVVTPEYNGGMAGSLKNTLDYFRPEFVHKPMLAVTVSSGNFGGLNALHQLWFWMLYVEALVVPNRLQVSRVNEAFDEAGTITDERLARNGQKAIENLIWLTKKIHS